MFLEYFIWGAWYVTLGTWLGQTLHFSGQEIALAAGTTALGAMLSPFLVGLMADELFANQRLLAALHGVGGILLWFASTRTTFGAIYFVLLIYALCYMPTMALTNALAFRQMKDPKQDFGSIRVLGTAGWIVAGLIIGYMGVESTAVPIRVAAVSSIAMAIYSLTLPHTPPLRSAHGFKLSNIFPPEAFALFKDRNFSVFVLASFLICIPLQFYYTFTNPFLNEIGVQNAAGKMTMGQMSELLFMVTLPWFFRRLGVKYTLMLGMFAWVLRYICFGMGNSRPGLRRSESARRIASRRTRADHLHHLRNRYVYRFLDLRTRRRLLRKDLTRWRHSSRLAFHLDGAGNRISGGPALLLGRLQQQRTRRDSTSASSRDNRAGQRQSLDASLRSRHRFAGTKIFGGPARI